MAQTQTSKQFDITSFDFKLKYVPKEYSILWFMNSTLSLTEQLAIDMLQFFRSIESNIELRYTNEHSLDSLYL